ncbi:winged helix-turn-helix transcriptional regulator [Actinoplanes sp. NPDC051513]|uniref:winged helix-turn-helix transcriptional regulator n=1 Tax=Actinoplanes sp. NPDC051513 TaxID=3363908 RepID=UPI0037A89A0C
MDLLGRRWALRLIWELRDGPVGARALLARCEGLSSSVLYQRLGELTGSGLALGGNEGYELTPLGKDLGRALGPLDEWANRWAELPGERGKSGDPQGDWTGHTPR